MTSWYMSFVKKKNEFCACLVYLMLTRWLSFSPGISPAGREVYACVNTNRYLVFLHLNREGHCFVMFSERELCYRWMNVGVGCC